MTLHRRPHLPLFLLALFAAGAMGQTAQKPPVKTTVIRGGEPAQHLAVNVAGLADLYLVVTIGGDNYSYDQAIWAEPKLIDTAGKAVDLTTLAPHRAQVGWGQLVANQNHNQRPLSIAGKAYAKGFWAHGPSVLHFKLDGKYTRFEAQVGIDTGAGTNGSVEFEVTAVAPALPPPPRDHSPPPPTAKLSAAGKGPQQFNPAAAKVLIDQGVEKLVFVRRFTFTADHSYTEHINSRWTPGGGLCILDLRTGAVTDLVPELNGGVFNRFDISWDATRIVFDYKKSAMEGYRIYEVGVDGKGLRQLTFPVEDEAELVARYRRGGYHHGTDDMQPCYLPNGEIIFTSTRCRASVLCDSSDNFTTTVLHRMDADGRNIRQLSHNPVSEFSPAVLPDGRVMYMRWEYNRKGAGAVKCLWSMFPDVTASAEVYGNMIVDPQTMMYGRPVPGADDKVVFLGASHWGPNNAMGTVIVLDMTQDPQSPESMTRITRDVDARSHDGFWFLVDGQWVHDSTGEPGRLFKDPYALSEKLFLAAHKPRGLTWHDPKGYDLCLLDEQGRETVLYRDEEISCWHPYPLRARPMPPMPTTAIRPELAAQGLAQCVVADVYAGLDGVERGTVKYLRILEQTPRPWSARNAWKGDQHELAHSAMGFGVLGMQAQHGVVPVEEDGSANFHVPAGRNLYFQALDDHYMAVQTERTYINYIPGEMRSCVGCHERSQAAPSERPLAIAKALRRSPSTPGPQPGEASGQKLFDYARQIQPIWDRHCIGCHTDSPDAPAALNLMGTPTTLYNASYENLLGLEADKSKRPRYVLVGAQVNENDVRAFVEYAPPYFFGAHSSILAATFGDFEPSFQRFGPAARPMAQRVKALREQHREVRLSREEFIRIVNWLDASCQYHPSYWGMKNIAHSASPHFRPEIPFHEALGDRWPAALRALYGAE